jgi:prepilin peptidase CpaA
MISTGLNMLIGGVLIAAALSDAVRLRIPNILSVILIVLFGLVAITSGMSVSDVLWRVAAGGLVLAVGFALFAVNLFGGGDVKLLAAVSLLVGWSSVPSLLAVISIVGGLLAGLIIMLRLSGLADVLVATGIRSVVLESERLFVPYGIAIAAGWFLVGPLHLI